MKDLFPYVVKHIKGCNSKSYKSLALILVCTIHQLTEYCVLNFNLVTLTVLEKSATKMYLMRLDGMTIGMKEGRNDGNTRQIQYNPTFLRLGYDKFVTLCYYSF